MGTHPIFESDFDCLTEMTKEVAAITGGTSGLGKAFVERFSRDGYQVVFCGRNEKAGAEVAEKHNAHFVKADVTKANEVDDFFKQIKEKFGGLHVLINNAGFCENIGRTIDIPDENFVKMMDINTNGAFYTLKYGVKLMEETGTGGRVVNISSLAGLGGAAYTAGAGHYGASKHALNGLTKVMALEHLKAKIRINAVAPTVIETSMVTQVLESAADSEQVKAVIAGTNPMVGPGDKLPQAEDVSGVVSFLCGPESKFINGAIIPIDGGYNCK